MKDGRANDGGIWGKGSEVDNALKSSSCYGNLLGNMEGRYLRQNLDHEAYVNSWTELSLTSSGFSNRKGCR